MKANRNIPKIAIVVPVYNVEEYLRQCLDSIISQTFTDFECVCVNDGSTDNSLSILEEYAKKDDRIIVISQENKGASCSRNMVLKDTNAKYVTFIDSDDWLEKNYLETLYNVAIKNDADLVRASYKMYYQKDDIYESARIRTIHNISNMNNDLEKIKKGYDGTFVCSKLIKMDLLRNNSIYYYEGCTSEDSTFMALVFLYAKNIVFIKDEIYYYRKQIRSVGTNVSKTSIDALYNIITLTKDLEKRNKVTASIFDKFILNKFVYKIGKLDKRVPKERRKEILDTIVDFFYYLTKISKNYKNYKIFLKLNIIKFVFYVTSSFKFFRLIKNLIK